MATKRRLFGPEFKRKSADLVLQQSYSSPQICEAVGVGETAFRRWVQQLSPERSGIMLRTGQFKLLHINA